MNIPYFSEYLGPWAMRAEDFTAGHALLMGLDLHVHLAGPDPHRAAELAEYRGEISVQDGVAVIALHGVLMKHQSSMQDSTSTVVARRLVRQATRSPDVQSILLHIDSPGGTVSGTPQLADDVATAAKAKPTIAYIENLCASAAYWIASQAGKIVAAPASLIGAIGTYGVIHDMSAAATLKGIKVHVVKAGAMKGAGVPGTEITAEQLAEHQRIVNDLNAFFLRGVASGRGMALAKVGELADGRVHVAAQAQQLGLIDGLQSLDATWNKLVALSSSLKGKAA
jgi:signal peptide peptidase SppA